MRHAAFDSPSSLLPHLPKTLGNLCGFGTKILGAVNGLGLPVRLIQTPGQAADVMHAKKLIEGNPFELGIGDKGYDSQALVDAIQKQGGTAVLPSRKNQNMPRGIDGHLYKERNLVARF